jgi:hypothetical protein
MKKLLHDEVARAGQERPCFAVVAQAVELILAMATFRLPATHHT